MENDAFAINIGGKNRAVVVFGAGTSLKYGLLVMFLRQASRNPVAIFGLWPGF